MLIYKITNSVNGKVYIGQTTRTLEQRKKEHLQCVKQGVHRHLYDAMRKHGVENFEFKKLCSAKSRTELNYLEAKYIVEYDSVRNGYNMGYGGESDVMFSPCVKEKHDAVMRSNEVRKKISQSMKKYRQEHPFTEEHRRKISEKAMGNNHFGDRHDTRSIPCYCIDEKGIKHDFSSYKEAGLWWFEQYQPFGERYSQAIYQRKIITCIELGYCTYGKQKQLINNIKWFRKEGDA